jgi:hypothetical protein
MLLFRYEFNFAVDASLATKFCNQVVLLYDPAAAPAEKDPKKKNDSQSGPNPNGWTKPIKYAHCTAMHSKFNDIISIFKLTKFVDFRSPSPPVMR